MIQAIIFILALFLSSNLLAQTPPSATLTWNFTGAPGTADDFQIERRIGQTGTWVPLTTVKVGVLIYVDSTISQDVEYCYRVLARKATLVSPWSNIACGTNVSVIVPPVAPSLTLKMSDAKGIQPLTVSWTAPPKPSKTDWVGLYLSASTDRQFLSKNWVYTNGAASGTFTTTPSATGTYNFRYLLDDGFTSVSRSYDVVVK